MTTIRVGIAHESPSAIEVLRRAIAIGPTIEVAWVAKSADECSRRATDEPVGLLLLSVNLPGGRVASIVRTNVERHATVVVLVRDTSSGGGAEVYSAMDAGAADVVDMPGGVSDPRAEGLTELRRKLSLAARLGKKSGSEPTLPAVGRVALSARLEAMRAEPGAETMPLVILGASTGGPAAIARVLSGLARPLECAVVIVQHVDGPFAPTVASWLARDASLEVALIAPGDRPRRGIAMLAATSDHLVLEPDGRFAYSEEPKNYPYRPSVDVFCESVAKNHRGPVVAALLTGMGRDGAKGLVALRQAGHATIAQDESTSVVFGMPRAAVEMGGASEVRPIERVASAIDRSLLATRAKR